MSQARKAERFIESCGASELETPVGENACQEMKLEHLKNPNCPLPPFQYCWGPITRFLLRMSAWEYIFRIRRKVR
jgi:hypothetical protein